MFSYIFKRGLFRIKEMGFGTLGDVRKNRHGCDVIYMHSNDSIMEKSHASKLLVRRQATLVNDLTLAQDALFNSVKKNCRYEIRRAEREGCKAKIFTSSDLESDKTIIAGFQEIYNKMFEEKGMAGYSFNKKMIDEGVKNNSIIITVCEDIGNRFKVYHAYLIDGTSCVLVYSASSLWNDGEKQSANLIGWMNKFLHWNDILFFKQNGYSRYEWGGISSLEEPNGIDRFKMEFGGEAVEYNNYIVACSLLGRLYTYLVNKR